MKQTRQRDINADTTFVEIGKEIGEDPHTTFNCHTLALARARKYLEQNGIKKTDFFGDE